MPERCDICGIAALETEHFAQETLPFIRTKRYCPACRQRLYRRVFAVLTVVPVVVACAGIFNALRRHASLLDSVANQWALLFIFHWVMILPHELGHAAAGRVFGFKQIRILIGSGKHLFSFQLFGFPTLVNLIPFGGITLSKPPNPTRRWQYLVFVGAGLLVNGTAAAIAWCFAAPGALFNLHTGSAVTPFFWSNVLVLAENLFPHQVQTPYGTLNNDGLQLWNVLFRWNKPLKLEPARVPAWELALRHLFKWTIFLVMVGAALLFIAVGTLPFLQHYESDGWEIKIVLPAIMLGLALVTAWAAVRIVKHPIRTVATPGLPVGFRQLLSVTPEQNKLLRQAIEYANQKDFPAAEALLDQALAGTPESKAIGRWPLQHLKLEYIVLQNDVSRAEKACLDWVNQAATIEEKIRILDGFISQVLYKSIVSFLNTAERLARQALELAPGTLTLKGTLGGVLVEQGRFAEAEPLLRECLERSPALHDQGISAFYLGVAKLSIGDRNEAKRLIKRGMVLYPEPWLLAKAQAKLKELDR
jgi:tetratricopeptide (TPR) repeat protein